MNEYEKKKLIYQVVRMYYMDGLSQVQIAKKLNLSKPKVSRIINEAREKNYVEIKLNFPYQNDSFVERALIHQFQLRDARILVAQGLNAEDLQIGVGEFAAELLDEYLRDQMIFAISRGKNVYSTVKAIRPRPDLRLKIVQVQGAMGDRLDDGSDLVIFLSRLYTAEISLLHAPLLLESPEAAKILLNEPSIKSTLALAKNADIALLGIGSIELPVFSLYRHNLVSPNQVEDLRAAGVVGDVAGCFIDANGEEVDIEFNRRLVRIRLEDLKKIPVRIGVGCGLQRVAAIRAALKSNIINILVTDSAVAVHLLES